MREVIPGVARFARPLISNVYLVRREGSAWLVDTGHVLERGRLLRALTRAGVGRGDLTGIVLTHRHTDHAGNAAFLRERLGAPVWAHEADAAVLAGVAPARPIGAVGTLLERGFAALENRWPVRLQVDATFRAGDRVGDLEVHHTPGHTEGSVLLRHTSTAALFTGDTLLAAHPPLVLRQGLALPHPSFAVDLAQAMASLRSFHASNVPYEHLLSGHGRPIVWAARQRVGEFLASATPGA